MYIWNIAADVFGFSDKQIEEMIYITPQIRKFLDTTYSMGISACKGMGKTFVLKAKRIKMMQDSSYLILPKNQMVDTPGPIIIGHNQMNFLSSYHNWVAIWTFCICAYLLSQDEFEDIRKDESIRGLDEDILKIIDSQNDGVFGVLSRLLSINNQTMLRRAVETSPVLFAMAQRINRQVVLFVDKIEEPFNRGYYKIPGSTNSAEGRYNHSIWAYAQLSFAEAVYILYSGRHHIKIYYSIRQEALHGGETIATEFSKMNDELISKIEYDSNDLKKMFYRYIHLEKDENLFSPKMRDTDPCAALCGISTIEHRSGLTESVWSYMSRHSLGRPRDLMQMAIALYENIVQKSETLSLTERKRECRHWINEISARICKEYLFVLEPFMGSDDNIVFSDEIIRFFGTLPTNIFTLEATKKYCHLANHLYTKAVCTNCTNKHYFSTLYNIGLLGYIYESVSEPDTYKNYIKRIGDSIFNTKEQTLPIAELYYVHPGIGNIINEERGKNLRVYRSCNSIINSDEVSIKKDAVIRLKHFSSSLLGDINEDRVFITSTGRDLQDEREEVATFLKNRGYEVLAYEREDFPAMDPMKTGKGATHDHCIDVALSCKHLIYIIDGRFGGTYAGNDYKSYIKEKEDIIKITPSVSFMEYLVAKAYNKDVKVYMLDKVEIARGEYIANKKPANYHSFIVDEKNAKEVFEQIGYLNALGNGTWYDKYSSISNLKQFLDVRFPRIESAKKYEQ